MSKIHFFTPIHYGAQAKTTEEKAIQNIDNYFHICGRKAVVIRKTSDGNEIVRMTNSKISAKTVFKTMGVALSFATLVIPLGMLLAKAALRSSHKYVIENQNSSDIQTNPRLRTEKKPIPSENVKMPTPSKLPKKEEGTMLEPRKDAAGSNFDRQSIRQNHVNWLKGGYLNALKTRGIVKPKFNVKELSSKRLLELSAIAEKELIKINKGVNDLVARKGGYRNYTPPKDFLKTSSVESAKALASVIVPCILANLTNVLEDKKKFLEGSDVSEDHTMHLNSLKIHRKRLFEGVEEIIENSDKIDAKLLDSGDLADIAEQLAHVTMNELERDEDICYYDPGEETRSHNICWIHIISGQ